MQSVTSSNNLHSDYISPSDESEAERVAKLYSGAQGIGEEVTDYDNDELRDILSEFGVESDLTEFPDAAE